VKGKFRIFILLIYIKTYGQNENVLFWKFCNGIDKISTNSSKLHIIGEYHYFKANLNLHFSYLKLLNDSDIYPKYLVFERGPAYAYICNKYLETGDSTLIKLIEALSQDQVQFEQLRKYRLLLPNEKKFYIVGADYEDNVRHTHFVIRDILLSNLKLLDSSIYNRVMNCDNYLNSFDNFLNLVVSFKIKNRPDSWGKKDLWKDVSEISEVLTSSDSTRLKLFLGNGLKEFQFILSAYEAPIKNKKIYSTENNTARDKYMATNIYNKYLEDTTAVMVGQLGNAHVPKKYMEVWSVNKAHSVALFLNGDPAFKELNSKVYSNSIVYQGHGINYCKRYLGLKKSQIKKVFAGMKDCDILFQKYQDTSIIDNLIYLKN
jgi:hypothetical protein